MSNLKLAIKTQTFHPHDGGDLLKILGQAKENALRIKQYGGSFPANSEGAEVLIALDNMRRIVWYDPEEQTLTVEAGLTLNELLTRMQYINYTIELYGFLPNMTVADAISVGLIGSNGTISHCLKSCQVLQSDGALIDWEWPYSEQISDQALDVPDENNVIPTLQTLVCGLGVVGIITAATLRCIPLHLSQEITYECSIDEALENVHQLSESLYSNCHWFPLLNKVIVTNNYIVRLQQGFMQPWWKKYMEYFFRGIHMLINRASPFVSWYIPSFAKSLSKIQFDLLLKASSFRTDSCFKPQVCVSVRSYCRGIKWVLPADHLRGVVRNIEDWAKQQSHLCSTPLIISLQTHSTIEFHRPFLCPYSDKKTCTLWTDWFNSKSITCGYSATMAEFESLLQKNGGRKCWSAGPVYASPLIGQMYPGFRQWCRARTSLDPHGIFRSAYVEGDLYIESV